MTKNLTAALAMALALGVSPLVLNVQPVSAQGAQTNTNTTTQNNTQTQGGADAQGNAGGGGDAGAGGAAAGGAQSGGAQAGGGAAGGAEAGGGGAAGGGNTTVDVTPEQQTEIRTVITGVNVTPVPSVDFDINVGVAVPSTIELHPLPPRIVELLPAYQGYLFFMLADGRIVIVNPDTLQIVLVISA